MDDAIELEYCAHCKLPLEKTREQFRRIGGVTLCLCCWDVFHSVSDRKFFVDAQAEYTRHLDRLRPGGDYFKS